MQKQILGVDEVYGRREQICSLGKVLLLIVSTAIANHIAHL